MSYPCTPADCETAAVNLLRKTMILPHYPADQFRQQIPQVQQGQGFFNRSPSPVPLPVTVVANDMLRLYPALVNGGQLFTVEGLGDSYIHISAPG